MSLFLAMLATLAFLVPGRPPQTDGEELVIRDVYHLQTRQEVGGKNAFFQCVWIIYNVLLYLDNTC